MDSLTFEPITKNILIMQTDTSKRLKENLTKLLASRGLNPTEFASMARIPRATVQKLLDGLTENPRNITLTAITKFFDVSIENLLYGDVVKTAQEISQLPLLKRSEVDEWLAKGAVTRTSSYHMLTTSRKVSDRAFAIVCNETGSAVFRSGSHLIFDPNIEPSDDSYVLIKLFDHNEMLFRQISIDVGVTFVKSISSQLSSASRVRDGDKIIATLIQAQINFEEI